MMLLFGWDVNTWRHAIAWAGATDLEPADIADKAKWPRFIAIREKWLSENRSFGGPQPKHA